jgi:arsenate reductase-like glutaredoxin family protein
MYHPCQTNLYALPLKKVRKIDIIKANLTNKPMPNIQIFGRNKCQDTRAAVRFFKERRVPFHFVDLDQRALSPGELSSLARAVGLANLIDTEGREYQRLNLKYQRYDIERTLLENPKLLKTPIVRNGRTAAIGSQPEQWRAWLEAE